MRLEKSIWKEFLAEKKISKDLNSIRAKKVMIEDILEWLLSNGTCEEHNRYSKSEDLSIGYHEVYYKVAIEIEIPFTIHVAWAAARLGIPSLSIAVDTQKEWLLLREKLREAELVRTDYSTNYKPKKKGE
jgi:hypothetical protein